MTTNEKLPRASALKTLAEQLKGKLPTSVSQLTNDSGFQTAEQVEATVTGKGYQTGTQVETAIQTAIAATGHASFEKVDAVPAAADAEANKLYLVMNVETSHYDIYAKVGEEVVLLDDTTVDLSGYVTKETGKGLSTNDYTDEDKAKLAGLEFATDEEITAMLAEVFGA